MYRAVLETVGCTQNGAAGRILGIYLGERARSGDADAAWRATRATIRGFGVAALLQFAAGLLMAAIWVAWVLL